MIGYTFKTYIVNGREHFCYGESEIGENLLTEKDFLFPESLLKLLRIDIWQYEPLIKDMERALLRFYKTQQQEDVDIVLDGLDTLSAVHIYFQLLRLDWRYRFEQAKRADGSAVIDLLPRKKLTHIPSNIDTIQKQVLRLFQNVLDVGEGKKSKSIPERIAAYYHREGTDTLNTFHFGTLPLKFEAISESTFIEVLYPDSIYDLIDYALRECVQREQRMRLCKNCGHYFALTGRSTAEYCDITLDEKGRTCKEIGAIHQWTKSKAGDEAFKLYRREYKRRFAWIKAGKISPEVLYAWGKTAREKKDDCDEGKITLKEYETWLRTS